MKRRLLLGLLLAMFLLAGCAGEIQTTPEATPATETPTAEIDREVRPGIYMSNDPADFPFPVSGYTVYIMGENHGNRETKQLFLTYLKALYKEAGLRDVILEEHQAYESDANAYVQGKLDALPEELCRRTDILGIIREFNAALPEKDKVVVHLVDVDSPLSVVYKHLAELHAQLGSKSEAIILPVFAEFENWSPRQVIDLLTALENAAAGQPDILNGLETVHQSFRWHSMGNDLDTINPYTYNWERYNILREDIITQNVQYVVTQLDGKPVLAFFGAAHGMKANPFSESPYKDHKNWAQRLNEGGVNVYSLLVDGISGEGYWRGETFQYGEPTGQFRFEDDTLISSYFNTHPDTTVVYADFRAEENQNVKLPLGMQLKMQNTPASQVFDGLVLYREFTPMENACQTLE